MAPILSNWALCGAELHRSADLRVRAFTLFSRNAFRTRDRKRIPSPNLLLRFPNFDPEVAGPWLTDSSDDASAEAMAERTAARRAELAKWSITETELANHVAKTAVRVITPGSYAGEPLHLLSALERRSSRWDTDPEAARDTLSAAVSLVLRLLGRDPDPAKSREHVMLSVLAERRLAQGQTADLASLMQDLTRPPLEHIGALPVNEFLKRSGRTALAAALNSLLGEEIALAPLVRP